ncbi:MAG: phosphoenolpyruvate synthase [Gammaproteobacteria bacterium]|nr:phosphoenolpyruvate synthase [Rhodocyclaceae bacterium]MBU3908730.1 phosphoenolpyruvate synthase [Gammaproteobacteria bacterium]MBU3988852.1 phosphoenolpyruvate synthase [Gammaproteobacteria bacterium]MBU4004758.1 phosphoenolpyruvate synthase [Gammaproteobacteria bacterium]MBU4021361.1 phosphoenolpyruvate synthase [Gammaproteobacteria bacterium]
MSQAKIHTRPFAALGNDDVSQVGGKNASLGEMTQHLGDAGIHVPEGFATTASAYRDFLEHNKLSAPIKELLEDYRIQRKTLEEAGAAIRQLFLDAAWPDEIAESIRAAYRQLAKQIGRDEPDVAVRSSATAEDLPDASFAGQHESYLNIRGEAALLDACRRCLASLFTDRAIAYRDNHGFDHMRVALSVGVQRMVRSDSGAAGVMFSLDTETGFPDVVLIDAVWGLGETVVQGSVDPDEYQVFKPLLEKADCCPIIERQIGGKANKLVYAEGGDQPTRLVETDAAERTRLVLSDAQILQLARWAVAIEAHYQRPMDMEWALDGETGELFIVQARPETVQSRVQAGALKSYRMKAAGERLVSGNAVGDAIAAGQVCRMDQPGQAADFPEGGILVTAMTDPDWVPIMKRAGAIVTDHGGRTSHAAIVSRELGLPAVIGTGNATAALEDGQEVTVSCAEGDTGFVYAGILEFEARDLSLDDIPPTRTQVMLILADPAAALRWWRLPADGVGLARMEFIINNLIKIHPMALVNWDSLEDATARTKIEELTRGWTDKQAFFVDTLARGIARIAASRYPKPVILRMSDFKSNEYARLIGGQTFEPDEENPMLGWRGASRYYSPDYQAGFALECRAVKMLREEMGFDNVIVMIPFCRTTTEADRVLAVMAEYGLTRGERGLEIYVMCEIPANIILAEAFAERFDGFSIGSNDLTQLTLGVDRDSARLAELFDERDEAVKTLIRQVIQRVHALGRKVGLCGQAPSDHPDFAAFLVEAGIDSISVNPDSFIAVKQAVAKAERGP